MGAAIFLVTANECGVCVLILFFSHPLSLPGIILDSLYDRKRIAEIDILTM
ncbi:hypothetical protein ykris0001_17090 [Yersinia kristensenii ATCC 33638]|nr:hypothetical protein ykris0001_17090 [Yersinia kristensenii ATCC 33638]